MVSRADYDHLEEEEAILDAEILAEEKRVNDFKKEYQRLTALSDDFENFKKVIIDIIAESNIQHLKNVNSLVEKIDYLKNSNISLHKKVNSLIEKQGIKGFLGIGK